MFFRFARALAVVAIVLALATPALAGDEGAVKRALDGARQSLKDKRFHEIPGSLERAKNYLDGLDPAKVAEYQKEIEAIAKEAEKAEFDTGRERRLDDIKRKFESVDEEMEDVEKSKSTRSVDGSLSRIESLMAVPEKPRRKTDKAQPDYVTDAERKQFAERIEGYRKKLRAFEVTWALERTERAVVDIEEVVSGKKEPPRYRENLTSSCENVLKQLADKETFPQDDPRVIAQKDRVKKASATWDKQMAQGDKEATIKHATDWWQSCQKDYGKDAEGWEQENTPASYPDFLGHSPMDIGCKKTIKLMEECIQRFYSSDMVTNAVKAFPDDPGLKACMAEADKMRQTAGGKILKFCSAIIDAGEKAGTKRLEDEKGTFGQMTHLVTHACKGVNGQKETLDRIDGLMKKWGGQVEGAAKAKEELKQKLKAAADAAWPGFVEGHSDAGTIDALDASTNLGAWKGKKIRFKDKQNRAGWDYSSGDYTFITPVNGHPAACKLDGGIAAAIDAQYEATKIEFESGDIVDVVAIVEGICVVEQIAYSQITKQHYTVDKMKAPLLRIIAVKSGGYALDVSKGSSATKVEGVPAITVRESGGTAGVGKGGSGGGGSAGGFWGLMQWVFALGETFICFLAGAIALAFGASKWVPQLEEQRVKVGKGLGIAGAVLAGLACVWGLYTLIYKDFFPVSATLFAGAFVALDLLRLNGKLTEEMATKIRPAGIVLGLGAWLFALLHLFLWSVVTL